MNVGTTEGVTQYGEADRTRQNVKAYFRRWLLTTIDDNSQTPIPLFLVAAEGGGIRAGYWTARMLARIDKQSGGNFSRFTFAYSGVSGGSLGIVTYLDAARLFRTNHDAIIEAIDKFYAQDFLSPVLGRLLFTEPLQLLTFGLPNFSRRDTTFEHAIASEWKKLTQSDLFENEFRAAITRLGPLSGVPPAVLLNAAVMESGRQVVMSNIAPHQHQPKTDYLFSLDRPFAVPHLSLAEVVHLSARFPLISPPARVAIPEFIATDNGDGNPSASCNGLLPSPSCGRWGNSLWGTVVDGGYVDNSGINSLEDIYDALIQERQRAHDLEAQHESDPEERRYLSLLRRVSLHVLAIKNAPEHKKANGQGDPLEKATVRDELYVMVNTMMKMKTRTARAEVAAERLDSQIQFDEVNMKAPACWPARTTRGERVLPTVNAATAAACPRVGDSLHTSDLADRLADLKQAEGALHDAPCSGRVRLRPPPLGWTLSASSRRSIRCADEYAASRKFEHVPELGRAKLYWHRIRHGANADMAVMKR